MPEDRKAAAPKADGGKSSLPPGASGSIEGGNERRARTGPPGDAEATQPAMQPSQSRKHEIATESDEFMES